MKNEAFAQHVTSAAFSLNLTVRQIEVLGWLNEGHQQNSPYSHFVTSVNGLIRRGLVQHHHPPLGFRGDAEAWKFTDTKDEYVVSDFYPLTHAGHLVRQLCVEAGLL